MKIIIVGAGEVGYHIAQKLSEENQDVYLIDKDPEKIRRITENLDVQAILGSGTSPEMLKSSGIKEADMLVAATDSDEVNLFACLLAKNLNAYILKVARVRSQDYLREKELFSRELLAIDEIINPESVMVETIRNLMMVPGASDVIDFVGGRVKLIGITVKPGSPYTGRQLLSFKGMEERVLVGAIVRGEHVFIPHGEDAIQANDLVYLVVRAEELPHELGFFNLNEKGVRRVIIIGAGETGSVLAQALDQTKLHVKIIDKDSHSCAALAERLERVIVINGDGTDRHLLEEENINDVDFMVAVTGDEESNVLISLLAKGLGAKKNITRVNKLSYIPLVSAIGIDTVVSSRLSAIRAILQYIRRGKIISVAPLKGVHAEVIEAEALQTSDIVNNPLSRVNFPKGSLVGAVVRGEDIIIPRGDTVIRPKDRLIIFAKDPECRFFLTTVGLFVLVVTLNIHGTVYDSLGKAFRYAFFQVSSIMTTTGFVTADYDQWPSFSRNLLLLCMFSGGMAGSTGGGMKTLRIMLLAKHAYQEIFRIIHPHAITTVKLGGKGVPSDILSSIWGFFIFYLGLFVVSTLIMAFLGLDLISAFASVAACIFNVGPGLGLVGPASNYLTVPLVGKWVLIFCMLLGRLEIYTVIVLLIPEYWRK